MRGLPSVIAVAVLLSIIPSAAFADISVSSEIPVSPPVLGPADLAQSYPSVAGNGEMFLAAWASDTGSGFVIYVARVSRSGEALDRPARRIADASRGGIPRVAWNGRDFLVAWSSASTIYIATVNPAGEITADTILGHGSLGSFTCNASRCLAVVISDRYPREIMALMVDPDGRPIGKERAIAPLEGTPRGFVTATDGRGFLVTWSRWDPDSPPRYRLYAASVGWVGAVGAVHVVAEGFTPIGSHSVAATTDGYLLAWAAGDKLTMQRRSASGAPDGATRVNSTPELTGYEPLAMARVAEGHLLVASTLPTHARRARVIFATIGGDMTISEPRLLTELPYGPLPVTLGSGGDAVLAVWPAESATRTDLHGRVLRPHVSDEPIVISHSARPQRTPAAAFDGENVLTVWEEVEGNVSQIRGAFSRPGFAPAADFAIGPADAGRKAAAVAFNGDEYLVVRSSSVQGTISASHVTAHRLSRSGESIGEEIVITTGSCGDRASVASDGRDFLILWADCSSPPGRVAVSFIRAGMLAGDVTLAENSSYGVGSGGVAWSGQHFVATWMHRKAGAPMCSHPCYDQTIVAARITASGAVLDRGGITLRTKSDDGSRPDVVSNGDVALVAWRDGHMINGALIRPDGTSGPVVPLIESGVDEFVTGFSIGWAEPAFVLVWTRGTYAENQLMVGIIAPSQLGRTTAAKHAMPRTDDPTASPVIVGVGPRKAVLAYQRLADEPEYGTANRVFLRTLQFFGRSRAVRR